MMRKKITTPSSRITKIGGGFLPLKAFVICETESPSCFSCETDILWVAPLYKIGAIYIYQHMHTSCIKLQFMHKNKPSDMFQ
jgi:hypothetical protein